jgi:hypothetical protein
VLTTIYSALVSDSDLRQALPSTWRLINVEFHLDGAIVEPLGDNPQGYLVYTPDNHVFVQFATRADREWCGPEVFEFTDRSASRRSRLRRLLRHV